MSSVISIDDMNLNNSDAERKASRKNSSNSADAPNRLLSFGDYHEDKLDKANIPADSNIGKPEYNFTQPLGNYPMNQYSSVGGLNSDLDSFYSPSYSLNFPDYNGGNSVNPLGSFGTTPSEEKKLYSRHSLGGVFGYGENTSEPYGQRNDLMLSNLQDVMESDSLGPSGQGLSSLQGNNVGLNSSSTSLNQPPNSMMSNSSLFGLNNDPLDTNYPSLNSSLRTKELSPSFGASLNLGLNQSSNNFMLSSFDTNDYNMGFSNRSLTPQASRAPAYTPISSLYLDSNMRNDYASDSAYSPRYSPVPTSPYYNEDLSPRRLFPAQSTNSCLLMPNESPRLQRSLSSMGPSSTLGPLSSNNMDMTLSSSSVEYRGQSNYKSKERVKGMNWQTGDIDSFRNHIKEMSRDHNGCRTLQQCLDECPQKVVTMIYDEVGNELTDLMMDSFGNYLFQKLLDVSSNDQRREVLKKVKDKIVDASYNVHGTRSVQRLIQVCKEPDMVKDIMDALRGHIADLSSHSNGNHVIQRCLQHMPEEYRIDVFKEVVISTHRHGCCVVQRCLDSAPEEYHNKLLDAIVDNSYDLICNPFGNYVIQYLIEHGKEEEAERISRCVLGRVSELSCQKYSSNVIERILSSATPKVKGEIIVEIANSDKLHDLLHDKKALKIGTKEQTKLLLDAIRPYEEELGRSTGGKHILTQLNEITGTTNGSAWNKD